MLAAAAGLVLAGGGTALGATVASGPVDSAGVIHGCWTDGALRGSHAFVLQDSGTQCPRGTTPISWNQTGPAGPTGPQGPKGDIGPAGKDGADGQNGKDGTNGTDGHSVLSGSGAPDSGIGSAGDFYIDTTATAIYGPKSTAGWGSPTSLVGPKGDPGSPGTAGQDASLKTTVVALDVPATADQVISTGFISGTMTRTLTCPDAYPFALVGSAEPDLDLASLTSSSYQRGSWTATMDVDLAGPSYSIHFRLTCLGV